MKKHEQRGSSLEDVEAERNEPPAEPDHCAHTAADFRKRVWVSLVVTLPLLAVSPMLQSLVGLHEAIRLPGDVRVLFGLSSAVFWYSGWPFLKEFVEQVEAHQPGMRVLIPVAVAMAYRRLHYADKDDRLIRLDRKIVFPFEAASVEKGRIAR
jgi:cation transport ATPase